MIFFFFKEKKRNILIDNQGKLKLL